MVDLSSKLKAAHSRSTDIISYEEFRKLDRKKRVALIQQLVPLGLMAAADEFKKEVEELSGGKYQRKNKKSKITRHGSNPGSINIGGQQIPIKVPRIRKGGQEYILESYKMLHGRGEDDQSLLKSILYGVSCRNYKTVSSLWEDARSNSKSTVSRHFIAKSKKTLEEFNQRQLGDLKFLVIFLDGKFFKNDQMIIALGVTEDGTKMFLGFAQTDTENTVAISNFLKELLKRGLNIDQGILVIIDGSPGIKAGVMAAFKQKALIQRCQWHKRENVLEYVPKEEQSAFRQRLQNAYEQPTYDKANKELKTLLEGLRVVNMPAYGSLKEGLEETLTLHKLKIFEVLGRSLKTTNCLESVNSLIEERCAKIDHWSNAEQKHRWLALSLLEAEPRLKKIAGYKHLGKLKKALKKWLQY